MIFKHKLFYITKNIIYIIIINIEKRSFNHDPMYPTDHPLIYCLIHIIYRNISTGILKFVY